MRPAANSVKVKTPAIGRSASAASAAVVIFVRPWACKVAAVVTMMKNAMRLETIMPVHVSRAICRKAVGLSGADACRRRWLWALQLPARPAEKDMD
jgi:hypothetical protein